MRISWGLLGIWLLLPIPLQALNTQSLRPSTGAVRGYHLFTSEMLPARATAYGLHFNYDRQPFEVATVRAGSRRSVGIVDHFLTTDLVFAYGANERLNLGVGLPLNLYHNAAPTLIPRRDAGGGDIGDLWLNGKVQIFDADKTTSHLGLAVIPFLTIPTGRESIHFGDESVTGGGWLAGDLQWRENRFYLNAGSRFRHTRERIVDLIASHEFLFGAGFHRPLYAPWRTELTAEVYGSTRFAKFFSEHASTPVEAIALVHKKCIRDWPVFLHAGAGIGLTAGYSTSDVRGIVGATYTFGEGVCKPAPKKKVMFIRLKEKIHFYTDSSTIQPRSYSTLNDVVRILQDHPEVRKVQIEGHTDSRSSDAYNQKLSERRAKSVHDYLVSKGIESGRLVWVGYGESRPIASNETTEGRAMNRRTVLRVLEVDESFLPKGGRVRVEKGDIEFRRDETVYQDF